MSPLLSSIDRDGAGFQGKNEQCSRLKGMHRFEEVYKVSEFNALEWQHESSDTSLPVRIPRLASCTKEKTYIASGRLEAAARARAVMVWTRNKRYNFVNSMQMTKIERRDSVERLPLLIPLPRALSWMGVRGNAHADDDPILRYVPYFGDDDTTGVDVTAFERVPLIGSQKKQLTEVEEILILRLRYLEELPTVKIAAVLKISEAVVEDVLLTTADSIKREPETYEESTESYRELFCRHCYRYDCAEHGARQPVARERNEEAVFDDQVFEAFAHVPLPHLPVGSPLKRKLDCILSMPEPRSTPNNTRFSWRCIAQKAMDAFLKSENEENVILYPNGHYGGCSRAKRRRAKRRALSSGFKIQQQPLFHLPGKRLPRSLICCDHQGECRLGVCPCLASRGSCDKGCSCPATCRARFTGCRCKPGTCRTRSCECVAQNRECDADLCRCCDLWSNVHKCQNRTFANKAKAKRLALGRSSIHGWGTFCLEPAKCGDLIGEYRGELVSHEEADRRGKIYDKLACSFLFNLDDTHVVDATRLGTKIKFANHSTKDPNLSAKIFLVNSDHRIALIASRDIQPHEELFFNYSNDFWNAAKLEAASLPSSSSSTTTALCRPKPDEVDFLHAPSPAAASSLVSESS